MKVLDEKKTKLKQVKASVHISSSQAPRLLSVCVNALTSHSNDLLHYHAEFIVVSHLHKKANKV